MAITRMPPKKIKKAARAREQRKREARQPQDAPESMVNDRERACSDGGDSADESGEELPTIAEIEAEIERDEAESIAERQAAYAANPALWAEERARLLLQTCPLQRAVALIRDFEAYDKRGAEPVAEGEELVS